MWRRVDSCSISDWIGSFHHFIRHDMDEAGGKKRMERNISGDGHQFGDCSGCVSVMAGNQAPNGNF